MNCAQRLRVRRSRRFDSRRAKRLEYFQSLAMTDGDADVARCDK
jgi:hypothetical protein